MSRERMSACSAVSAARFLATSSTPEVSRSRRCTSSRKRASGRIERSDSITPWAMPLPPCTAMPDGLVDGEEGLVLEEDRQVEVRRRDILVALGHAHGRHADAVAGGHAGGRRHALAVHPHLAAAQDPVDVALRNALQAGEQVVVDALPGFLLGDLDIAHRAGGRELSLPSLGMPAILYVVDFERPCARPKTPRPNRHWSGRERRPKQANVARLQSQERW